MKATEEDVKKLMDGEEHRIKWYCTDEKEMFEADVIYSNASSRFEMEDVSGGFEFNCDYNDMLDCLRL
ncbi:MAG: hypothetical protein DRQ62_09490 [Gammaproteobacteria bacterium]|nr:MAG: hypothetical protein DRQ62_09490 [Gammaproteobacteria bacterium]